MTPSRAVHLAATPAGGELSFRSHPSRQPATLRLAGSADGASWAPLATAPGGTWQPSVSGVTIQQVSGHPDFVRVLVTNPAYRLFRFESEG